MFVSSYNTYVQPDTTQKNTKVSNSKDSIQSKSFDSVISKTSSFLKTNTINLPIDYISKSQLLHNKLELEFQSQQLKENVDTNLDKTKQSIKNFVEPNKMISARNSYESNSKIFSLVRIPHTPLSQTPQIDRSLPKEAQAAKEITVRHSMINTYLENDRYYQITA